MTRLDQKTLRENINKSFDKTKARKIRGKFGLKKSYQSREAKYVKQGGKTVVMGGSGSSKSLKKLIRSTKGLSASDRKRLRAAFKAGKTEDIQLEDNKLTTAPKEKPTSQNKAGFFSKKSEKQRINEQATALKEDLGGKTGFTSDGPPISRNDLYN